MISPHFTWPTRQVYKDCHDRCNMTGATAAATRQACFALLWDLFAAPPMETGMSWIMMYRRDSMVSLYANFKQPMSVPIISSAAAR